MPIHRASLALACCSLCVPLLGLPGARAQGVAPAASTRTLAWRFESTHDSDGDGIYDNRQGTAWVESWPGGQPHQEIYLALLDRQASTAMSALAGLLGDPALACSAGARAAIRRRLRRL